MTVWQPDTCSCVLEYDENIKWIKTYKVCEIHKQFSGQILLDEVLTHNREINKIRNQDIPKGLIQGTASVEFSHSMQNNPHNPRYEKILEAEYNLDKLKKISNPLEKSFQYELSNFLSSTQSILWHILEWHNEYFDLKVNRVDNKKFRREAISANNTKAIAFIDWYDGEYAKIRDNKKFGFLIEKRNINVHAKSVSPDKAIMSSDLFTVRENTSSIIPIKPALTKWYFDENTNEDVVSLCELFLNGIKRMVDDSKRTL